MEAAVELRQFPVVLRRCIHWFLPSMQKSRKLLKHFNDVMEPEIRRRKQEKESCAQGGKKPPVYNDTIAWMDEVNKGVPYSPTFTQMGLSLAALHTTSDLLSKVLISLCKHPSFHEPIRKEIAEVTESSGLDKASLIKLKLLDAFIKETQRLNPLNTGQPQPSRKRSS